MNLAILHALAAAVLFGASTPLAKSLLGELPPLLLAGLLYMGSGLGLTIVRLIRDRRWLLWIVKPSKIQLTQNSGHPPTPIIFIANSICWRPCLTPGLSGPREAGSA